MMMPPLVPAERQFNGLPLEPRSVIVVLDELTGAPKMISVVIFDQTRRHAYTD
jgi:hypothetical protein